MDCQARRGADQSELPESGGFSFFALLTPARFIFRRYAGSDAEETHRTDNLREILATSVNGTAEVRL